MNAWTVSKPLTRAPYSRSVDVGVLVPVPEAHQRLVRPGVVEQHRDVDDPGGQHVVLGDLAGLLLQLLEHGDQVVRGQHVGVDPDQVGGVGRADVHDPVEGSRSASALVIIMALKLASMLICWSSSTKTNSSPPYS